MRTTRRVALAATPLLLTLTLALVHIALATAPISGPSIEFDAKLDVGQGSASVRLSRRVPTVRLSRIRAFLRRVQRPAAMFSPARWTTASSPSRSAASRRPAAGSQRTSAGPGWRRTSRLMACPASDNDFTSADPISPLAPLIRMFMGGLLRIGE